MASFLGMAVSVLLSLGILLGLSAAAVAWRWPLRKSPNALLLPAGCMTGLIALTLLGGFLDQRPFRNPAVALASTGLAMGSASLAAVRSNGRIRIAGALSVSLALAVPLVFPGWRWAGVRIEGWVFGIAELLYALASGALLLAAVCSAIPGPSHTPGPAEFSLPWGLSFWTGGLVFQSIAAQLAWGAYWSWDPVECWYLAAWLITAIAALVAGSGHERARGAKWLLWVSALAVLAVWLGALPLVRWLGLASLYVMP